MKKLIIPISALALTAHGIQAQGIINANNYGSGVLITVVDPAFNPTPIAVGTPATAAGFYSDGPGEVSLTLYGALNGTALSALLSPQNIIATGYNTTNLAPFVQGAEFLGNPLTLPTKPGFDGSQALEFIFYGSDASGRGGLSTEATGIIPGGGINPTLGAAQIFGPAPGEINSFVITPTPEPSTGALVGLGAAALLFFRRRKQFTATHFS